MTAALLRYACTPSQVAISTAGSASQVGITFLVSNAGNAPVSIAQIALTVPQGDGDTDLMATGTRFTTGSVRSSNGAAWSLTGAGNVAVLVPVSARGSATLSVGDTLQFTLSTLTVNAAGAGQTAQIGVVESIHNGSDGEAHIAVRKIQPHFHIDSFYLDQYNVTAGSPVTVTWKVVDALSCEVAATIVQVDEAAARTGAGMHACEGVISSGAALSGSNTCAVQGATVFTLTALGKSAEIDISLTSQLLVTVNEPAINLTGFPPVLALGQTVALDWVAADAAKLQVYVVPSQGQPSIEDVTATPVGKASFSPTIDTNYFLYAFADASDPQPTRQGEVDVTVLQPSWTSDLAVSAAPTPAYPGDAITLQWDVLNCDTCTLTCDQPGFAPQPGLPIAGSRQVALPDTGVADANVTFTMTPVQFGAHGDFSATTATVAVTNNPNFSKPTAAAPARVSPGADIVLTWALDHADTAVITSDFPGIAPITVAPAAGRQLLQAPAATLSTAYSYFLTATGQGGKYTASSQVVVLCEGDVTVQDCIGGLGASPGITYVEQLFLAYPNQRIRQVQLGYDEERGIVAILVWYDSALAPDYALYLYSSVEPGQNVLTLAPGDYVLSLSACFANTVDIGSQQTVVQTCWMQLTTFGGDSLQVGVLPPGAVISTVSAPIGQQVIALNWLATDSRNYLGGLGIVSCTNEYGQ